MGYYLNNGTVAPISTTCTANCPSQQYVPVLLGDDLWVCYLCDTIKCYQCANSSTTCTSCAFPATLPVNYRWLYNYECLSICPHGYSGNNVTFICDRCPEGTYSFENICYSECPLYYEANDNLRACILPGGYPLNMTVQV